MNAHIRNQVIKVGLITSPIIALLLTTPIYIIRNNRLIDFFSMWILIFIATITAWIINSLIYTIDKPKYEKGWLRLFLGLLIMTIYSITPINMFALIEKNVFISVEKIYIIRASTLLSINLIVFIILDLVVSKESALLLNKENAELKFSNLEAEYRLLKEQINPHFLFNALNVSKSLISTRPKEAEQYIVQLSDFIRIMIDNQKKTSSLAEELQMVTNFVALQKIRFEAALQISIEHSNNGLNAQLPFFTLVSLLENAIKHNSFTAEKPLKIRLFIENDWIVLKNNIQPKFVLSSTRTGLININKRSKILTGEEIKVTNDDVDFTVKVKLLCA